MGYIGTLRAGSSPSAIAGLELTAGLIPVQRPQARPLYYFLHGSRSPPRECTAGV